MKSTLSKLRTRKTRSREKQSARNVAENVTMADRPSVAFVIAAVGWLFGVAFVGMDILISRSWTMDVLLPLSGTAALLLAGAGAVGLFLRVVAPELGRNNARILLLVLVSVLATGTGWTARHMTGRILPIPDDIARFLLPFALAPTLATILLNARAGLAAGLWTALVLACMAGGSLSMLLCGMVATGVSVVLMEGVRTRSKVTRRALMVGLAQVICVFGVVAADWETAEATRTIHQAAACLVGGLLSAAVALLALPFFEALFRITSDITLLELSDLGHPLLQRLALEAPGTYHHSLVVANLSSAAADAIGANSLLARVSAYFHDIGKLTKPEFFSENQMRSENPHDELAPSMSSLIVKAHVKEGLSLALHYKLPRAVLEAIQEHHGTSLMSCFHHKAMSQMEFETEGMGSKRTLAPLNEGEFRYGGPKPSTRESAILCIADGVEAASRSLEKVTPANLDSLVRSIVQQRIDDGQLDEAPLSMIDLTRIRKALVFTLASMLHGRVPYPRYGDTGDQQATNGAGRGGPAGGTDAFSVARGGAAA